jgi:ribosomal protein S18 acetylase RimI-like enzyme
MKFIPLDKAFIEKNAGEFVNLIQGWKFSSWTKDNFLYELPRKWEFSFAAYENDKLNGFCIASNKISDTYYIHLIFISVVARGKALGTQMIEHAKGIAKKAGVNKIELRCPETNAEAILFYEKAGFKLIEKLKDEISGDVADHYYRLNF